MVSIARRAALALLPLFAVTLSLPASAQYKVLQTTKTGGEGGFDYVYADAAARKLYVPRGGAAGHVSIYDLDSLKPLGDLAGVSGHGVAVSGDHGFVSSKPAAMFDAKSLALLKTIDVQGSPDGIFESAGKVYILSHSAPNVTVIDAKDGSIAATIDLDGAPEQGVADGKGHLFIDLEDKGSIAVVDTASNKMIRTIDLQGKGGTCAGLAIDTKNGILFATCRNPQTMVILSAIDGTILETLPIGQGTDGAVFNPATNEVFSSEGGGTLTVVKESTPTSFAVEQTVQTAPRAKTLTLDTVTGHLILVTAEFTPPPPPAPGERPARGQMIPGTFSIMIVGK